MSSGPFLTRRQLAVGATLLGCSLAATTHTEAAIVNIDLGPSGFNMLGMNAGVGLGQKRLINGFPLPGGGGIVAYNLFSDPSSGEVLQGLQGIGGVTFAIPQANSLADPRNFPSGVSIDWTSSFETSSGQALFRRGFSTSPDFIPGSFMGFRFTTDAGATYRYGWLEVTWNGSGFQVLSGAYESDLDTPILAGATGGGGGAIPLPGAAGLAACGLLGLTRRRRR